MQHVFLIIYGPVSQKALVDSLIIEMKKRALDIDAFNMLEMRYHEKETKGLLFALARLLQKWIVSRILTKRLLYRFVLNKITQGVSCIDIHYFTRDYVSFLEKYEKPYKITIWGSDFYRESLYWQERKKNIYRRAELIQVETDEVKNDLIHYDVSLTKKIFVCNFGVNLLSVIDKYKDKGECLINNPYNKVIVTCGYNGAQGQQHLDIFGAIYALPKDIREQLILFIPITYGLKTNYGEMISCRLNKLSCEYYLFKERLNDNDLAKLRIQTDIVVNIQITDSLSSSLIEHLYSGNILVAGNWLPYGLFDRYKVKYLKTSKQDLCTTLSYAINNISSLKEECKANHDKVKEFASWDKLSDGQYQIYLKILAKL